MALKINGSTIVDSTSSFFSVVHEIAPAGVWTWGANDYGQLGLNDRDDRNSPVQVGSLTNWRQVDSGIFHTSAVKTDGTLWSCGRNNLGQLGLGNITSYSSPVQVGSLTNWRLVACGLYHTAAVKTDGTLWLWGFNNYGQLGQNDTTYRSSPVQVGSLTSWQQVVCEGLSTAAIKTDGTLWTWGHNYHGQLGLGDTTSQSKPVQVGALTNWQQVKLGRYHTAAIKTDGTLWSWGYDVYGNLGLGVSVNQYSPVKVGALTDWSQVAVGSFFTIALKTDGTLWTWGHNNYGQLGLNDTANRSSPVQVGSLTNWRQVDSGNYHIAAVKTDGTLWLWGSNDYGKLGLGDYTDRSSPVQVGTLTNWSQVSASTYSVTANQVALRSTRPTTLNAGIFGIPSDGETAEVYSNGLYDNSIKLWKELLFTIPIPDPISFSLQQDTGAFATDNITNNGTIVVSGINVVNGTWQYSTNSGVTWSSNQPTTVNTFILSQNTYPAESIHVRQTNSVGYSYTATNSSQIIVDLTAPILVINTVSSDNILTYADVDTTYITGTVSDAGLSVTLTFNTVARSASVSGTSWSYLITEADLEALGEGSGKTISASATDLAGNTGSVTRTVTVNTWGSALFTSPTTTTWTPPLPGIKKVHVIAVGGGSSGYGFYGSSGTPVSGSGGGVGWKNNIPVTFGSNYTVVVGSGGAGGGGKNIGGVANPGNSSYFISPSTVLGGGAAAPTVDTKYGINSVPGTPGSYVGDGGTSGKSGVVLTMQPCPGGGGGYGSNGTNSYGGQGTSLYGAFGGAAGSSWYWNGSYYVGGDGGSYGGGGGAAYSGSSGCVSGSGAGGAVRIVWGIGRNFPSTNVNT